VPSPEAGAAFEPLAGQINVAARDTRAKSLNMIGPSVVERIDQLETAGLVTRSPVPGDRRASLVDLTGEGRALVARLASVMRDTEEALTAGLDPDAVKATRRVLTQVAERARTLRAGRTG
jgi:DNA-binding MarR family transcriptional regulator